MVVEHPARDENLDSHQETGDNDLSCGGHEEGFSRGESLLAPCEDPGDAVGFGEKRCVDHAEAETRKEATQGARHHRGFRQNRENAGVGDGHSDQNNVTQLLRGRLDDWSVVVLQKHQKCRRRAQETHRSEDHGHDGLGVLPLHVRDGQLPTR